MSNAAAGVQRRHPIYLIAAIVAAAALALGLWDLLVERDGGGSWIWSVAFPAALLVLVLLLRARGGGAGTPSPDNPHQPG